MTIWRIGLHVIIVLQLLLATAICAREEVREPGKSENNEHHSPKQKNEKANCVNNNGEASPATDAHNTHWRQPYYNLSIEAAQKEVKLKQFRLLSSLITGGFSQQKAGRAKILLRSFREVFETNKALYRRVDRFDDFLGDFLEAVNLSEAATVKLRNEYRKLQQEVSKIRDIENATADLRGTAKIEREKCRVVTVDAGLGVAVVNAGRKSGVHPGVIWINNSESDEDRYKVIESRLHVSAVVPLEEAEIEGVEAGTTLHRRNPSRTIKRE